MRQKIEDILADDGENPFFSFASFLFLLSRLYGGAMGTRASFYKKGILKSEKLPCKVISVGNLTVGGTGKTPMTIYLAKLLESLGYKVAIVSRGYKGRAEKGGGIVSDGRNLLMGCEDAGDEPFMLASKLGVPVAVGADRFAAGMEAAEAFAPDVMLLDDAFQHLRLKRDLDLLLMDSRRPLGNAHLLPRGPLREPTSALSRAHAFVLTRCDRGVPLSRPSFLPPAPLFGTSHVPYISETMGRKAKKQDLEGRGVFAFSGIAGNDDFRRGLEEDLGCHVTGFLEFPDHHRYSDADIEMIRQSADKAKADFLITTEKDHVRFGRRMKRLPDPVVMGIKISFGEDGEAFRKFVTDSIG